MDALSSIKTRTKRLVLRFLAERGYTLIRQLPRINLSDAASRFVYQKQFNEFNIPPGSTVLDIGGGNDPFPLATVLADRFLEPTRHRYEEILLDSRPFLICDVQDLPFYDKSIDFVYCSHVLEHVCNPIAACAEIVRVGKRGYIETPALMKDTLFSWAKGMHKWHVVAIGDRLVFFEYSERQLSGVNSDAWHKVIFADHYDPLQDLYNNNHDLFNVMFNWSNGFECMVFYQSGTIEEKTLV